MLEHSGIFTPHLFIGYGIPLWLKKGLHSVNLLRVETSQSQIKKQLARERGDQCRMQHRGRRVSRGQRERRLM